MAKLTYHGHSCWEISGDQGRLLVDPFLTGNQFADVGPEAFETLDAVVVTHGHGDHIGDTEAIVKKTGALVVTNFEIANYFAAKGIEAHPLHIGGGRQFPFGHVKLTVAHHGSSGPAGEYLGSPAGAVITLDGKKVYHAGDTAVFLDMKLIGELYGPLDAALLPIGDNFTMNIDEAVYAARLLAPKLAIPMHYNTFPPIAADPDEFVKKAEAAGIAAQTVAPGESVDLP